MPEFESCPECGASGFRVRRVDAQTRALECSAGHELRLLMHLVTPPVPQPSERSPYAVTHTASPDR